MKKHNLSTKIKILCSVCFFIVSTISCQNNSSSDVPNKTPASAENFPLKEYWHKDFDNEIKTMALGSGMLVIGSTDQNSAVIEAFDITSGTSLWKRNLQGTNNTGISIAIIDKLAYVIYPPSIFAIDLDTGKLVFGNDSNTSSIDEIRGFSNKHIFMVKISEGVFAFDKLTGQLSWQVSLGRGQVDVFPDTINKLVYIVHGNYIMAVNESNGTLAWQKDIGFHGSVGFYDNFIYYSNSELDNTSKTHLQAFSLNTNDVLWDYKLTTEIKCLKTTGDSVIAITNDMIFKFDRLSGEKTWAYYTSPNIYCPLIVMGKVIYLKDGDSNELIAIAEENGDMLGKLDFEDSSGIGYASPEDNLLTTAYPFNTLALYLKNSVYVYK